MVSFSRRVEEEGVEASRRRGVGVFGLPIAPLARAGVALARAGLAVLEAEVLTGFFRIGVLGIWRV